MALAVDSEESTHTGHASGTSPMTWSFTNTAGSLLYVGVAVSNTTGNVTVASAVSYGGVACTKVGTQAYGFSSVSSEVTIWRLLNPATGSNTVSVSGTGTGLDDIMAGAISFTGNDTSTPEGSPASAKLESGAGSTSPSVTVPSTTSGNIVIAMMDAGSAYSSTSNTLTWSKAGVIQNSAGDNAAMTRQAVSTSSTTMTNTIVQDWWGIVAVEVKAAAGGGAQDTPELRGRPYGLRGQMQMQQLLAQ